MRRFAQLALVGILLAIAVQLAVRSRPRGRVGPGAVAPDFTLPTTTGREVTLSRLRGRAVVLNFWATWCRPCEAEMPELAALYAASRGSCLEVLGIAADSPADDVVSKVARLGVTYPVLVDRATDGVSERFGIPSYPQTLLVDGKGRVRKVFSVAVGRAELEQALAPLLQEVAGRCEQAM